MRKTMVILRASLSAARARHANRSAALDFFCIFSSSKKSEIAQADAIYMGNKMRQNGIYVCGNKKDSI